MLVRPLLMMIDRSKTMTVMMMVMLMLMVLIPVVQENVHPRGYEKWYHYSSAVSRLGLVEVVWPRHD